MQITDLLSAYWQPIWDMFADVNVPGFNVSFLTFFISVFVFWSVCVFINRVINIGLSQDLGQAVSQKRGDVWQTEQKTFNADGSLKSHTFTISTRSKYKR